MRTSVHLTRSRRPALMAAGLALSAVTSACTASTEAASTSSSTGSSSSSAAAGSGAIAPVTDQTAISFVGGKGGAADTGATPVKVGFINQDTGVPSFPEASAAASAVTKYINEKLGGVAGHPLQLVTCSVSSEAQAQACAQQMLNDADIKVIQTGAMVVGNASLYNTVAGRKPILGGNPTAPADYTAKNTYYFTPGAPGVNGAIAKYIADDLKATKASVVHSDDPGATGSAIIGTQGLKAKGVNVTDIAFPSTGGDLTAPLTAAGATSADAIDFLAAGPACLQMAKAQKQLSLKAPIFSVSLCLDPSVKQQLGDFPTWTFGSSTPNPYVDGNDPQVNLFRSVMAAGAPADTNLAGFAGITFGSLLDLVKVFNKLGYGNLTSDSIGKSLASFTGKAFLGAPDIKCGALPSYPTVCADSARLIRYDGDGKWTDLADGKWISINN